MPAQGRLLPFPGGSRSPALGPILPATPSRYAVPTKQLDPIAEMVALQAQGKPLRAIAAAALAKGSAIRASRAS
jgi:hypothetical protein